MNQTTTTVSALKVGDVVLTAGPHKNLNGRVIEVKPLPVGSKVRGPRGGLLLTRVPLVTVRTTAGSPVLAPTDRVSIHIEETF